MEQSSMATSLLLLLLLLYLSRIIFSLADEISIDCGTSGSYVDSDNITWVGDQTFVTAGQSVTIPATGLPDSIAQPLTTLRYFPTGQTNCYTNIPVSKGEKILVRTSFYYGNYDGNFLPPTFNVVYDGKHQDTITTSLDVDGQFAFSEAIFVPGSGNISVCLVRTSSIYNPFISAIEVRSLDSTMYSDLGQDEGFILLQRLAYGSNSDVSYPSDPYGRIWVTPPANFLFTVLTSSAASIDNTGAENKPPEIVLRTSWSGDNLALSDPSLPIVGVPVYLAMYFSEPRNVGPTQKRSFNVFLDNTQAGSGPVVPKFGKPTQVVARDVVASSSSQLTLQATADSNLPPLINALELYLISNRRSGGGGGGSGTSGGGSGGSGTAGGGRSGGSGGTGGVANGIGGDSSGTGRIGGGKRRKNLPLILGVSLSGAFVAFLGGIVAFLRKGRKAKPDSVVTVTSAGPGGATGASPLVGRPQASEANYPANEPEMHDIEELIGVNDSYIVDDHHQHESHGHGHGPSAR